MSNLAQTQTWVTGVEYTTITFIEGTQADDISIWRGQPVPDLKLHKYNRYGHQVRPRQSLYRDLKEARQTLFIV